jgi:fibro-slime domain-containing protein
MRTKTPSTHQTLWLIAVGLLPLCGCGGGADEGSSVSRTNPGSGSGNEDVGGFDLGPSGSAGSGSGSTAGGVVSGCQPNLTGLVRDFHGADEPGGHGDFETFSGNSASPGIVQPALGVDQKPVYAANGPLIDPDNGQQTTTAEAYNQWYRDTPGVNQSTQFQVQLQPSNTPGVLTFDDGTFFPIDGQLFGNYANEGHNFHFTFELHTTFTYNGGEVFTFTGDDDLWVFINNKLAIDLGGLHPEVSDSVSLDDIAAEFGITIGGSYPLDLFHAERHTNASHFRIDTSIAFTNCEPILLR